jgi:hypothetical protein
MEIKADRLIDFLREVDKELENEIQLNAVGGTAMTLLGLKTSTLDIDFDMSSEDKKEFDRVLEIIPHGFKIDRFTEGYIFSQQLPEDYKENLQPIDEKFDKIGLFTLSPIDIVVTKISRLNERDEQDIESCIVKCKLTKEAIAQRAKQITHAGCEEIPKENLKIVLGKFFPKEKQP